MADNYLAKVSAQQPQTQAEQNMLQRIWDEASGAFARYGRRSGKQRDDSIALMNYASAPGTDPLTGAGLKALGLAGLVTHPLAFFPTGDEWRERLRNSGNDGQLGQAIGGMLGDLPSIVDPHLLAGGGALAAAPIVGKLGRGMGDLAGDATDAELAALRARLGAEAEQVGGVANATTRDEALNNLTGSQPRREFRTQSYQDHFEDGSSQWVPGTLRSNPTTAPRFQSEMTPADIRRYIEQFGEPPPERVRNEIVTQSYKEVYPDGTVKFAPGTYRSKRPPEQKK